MSVRLPKKKQKKNKQLLLSYTGYIKIGWKTPRYRNLI